MTEYLVDLASYQEGIDLSRVKAAGFNYVNVKLSEGTSYVWKNAPDYINKAKSLGMGISTFHWLNNSASGSEQAKIVQGLMKQYGVATGSAHQIDCEDNAKPATWQIWADYAKSMQDFLGHHVINYTGDWWWTAPGRNWNGSAITPYLWAAPNHGYDTAYPGDKSSDWHAGYGGWVDYSILQYAVGQVYSGAGADQCSKSAIKDHSVWAALTGSNDMALTDTLKTKTNTAGRTGDNALADLSNLRDFLIGAGQVQPGDATYPMPNSPMAMLVTMLNDYKAGKFGSGTVDEAKLASDIADKLIASNTNGLTPVDHDAIKADVREVLNSTKLTA